jgi:hypothetical protein
MVILTFPNIPSLTRSLPPSLPPSLTHSLPHSLPPPALERWFVSLGKGVGLAECEESGEEVLGSWFIVLGSWFQTWNPKPLITLMFGTANFANFREFYFLFLPLISLKNEVNANFFIQL